MRKSLTNGRGKKKEIDIVDVCRYIDSGHTVAETAEHFGVSESTLYKRHREYIQYWGGPGYWENFKRERTTGQKVPFSDRFKLAGRKRAKKKLDMSAVYNYIDEGHTIPETAEHFNVSVSTLYRRHREQTS